METIILFVIEVINPAGVRTFRSFESTVEGVMRLMNEIVQGTIAGEEDRAFGIIAHSHENNLPLGDLYASAVIAFLAHQIRVRAELENRIGSPTGVMIAIDATAGEAQPAIMIIDYDAGVTILNRIRGEDRAN